MLLLLISFVAGFLTILAPCVLPLIPVIIGGSISGNTKQKSRPYIIAASLATSIIVFTLVLKLSTSLINLSPNALLYASGGIVIALGLVSVFPDLWEKLIIKLNWQAASQRFLGKSERNKGKYAGPILIGLALGPVFSSCSPTYAFILASVLPRDFFSGLIYLITYSLALVVALLLVSLLGKKFISKFNWAVDTHGLFRRILGVIFILIGIAIISGQEVRLETWVGNHLPFDEAHIEQVLLTKQHKAVAPALSQPSTSKSVLNVQPTPAPEFVGLTNWINSPPLTIAQLQGKVVLVDFWTYSCVNCNRALPYVEKWYQTYQNDGLVVVGVHTPEFAFEHNPTNVSNFVKNAGITYPVALDNDNDTWNAYSNDSWPADYLIDRNGNVRYIALGEGNYNVTEEAIQDLLGVSAPLKTPKSVVPITRAQTPETYFGSDRVSDYSGTPSSIYDGTTTFMPVSSLSTNNWTLSGKWTVSGQYITSESSSSSLTFNTQAKDVYVVAGSTNNQPATVKVGLAGSSNNQYGPDDPNGNLIVGGSQLYHIVSLKSFGNSLVTLTVPAGVSLYTFTFGS